MKKVLRYSNRKVSPVYWDMSTADLENGAYLALFHMLENDWCVYTGIEDEPEQNALYLAAKGGDATAAKYLLKWRKGYEHEDWSVEEVGSVPLKSVKGGFASDKQERDLIPADLTDPVSKRSDEAWSDIPRQLRMARINGPALLKKVSEAIFDISDLIEASRDPENKTNQRRLEAFRRYLEKTTWSVESTRDDLGRLADELKNIEVSIPLPVSETSKKRQRR